MEWLEHNSVFAWHIKCDPGQIKQAQKIGNSLMDDINAAFERGDNPFKTIRSLQD